MTTTSNAPDAEELADQAAPLDALLVDAALGPLRRFAPDASAARFAAALARQPRTTGRRLGSRAMRVDAIESMTCGWLSLVVVVGLVANLLLGAWWVDAVTSLGIVWFVVKEAREAWSGEDCCSDE